MKGGKFKGEVGDSDYDKFRIDLTNLKYDYDVKFEKIQNDVDDMKHYFKQTKKALEKITPDIKKMQEEIKTAQDDITELQKEINPYLDRPRGQDIVMNPIIQSEVPSTSRSFFRWRGGKHTKSKHSHKTHRVRKPKRKGARKSRKH